MGVIHAYDTGFDSQLDPYGFFFLSPKLTSSCSCQHGTFTFMDLSISKKFLYIVKDITIITLSNSTT